ncbi:MAG TPA: hypothetical protein VJ578_02095, partial [Dehalococcoidia bacterium]|nr:hypothetical protein [Dehalococcoidia bacterium]
QIEILGEHIADREPRRRHRYSPKLRFRVLEHMRKFMLTVDEAARRFYVTAQTIYNWLGELRENPDAQTVGSLLKPVPPIPASSGNSLRRSPGLIHLRSSELILSRFST